MHRQYFKNSFSENIFKQKYAHGPTDDWGQLCERLVEDVCGSRQARNTKKDCFDRKTQRALQKMEAHFLMCSFLGEVPL